MSRDKHLYMKIYDSISADNLSGRLPPHSRLPSKRELCALWGVSQSTAETAYGILAAEGYIYSLPKRGYFASSLPSLPAIESRPTAKKSEADNSPAPQKLLCRLSTNGADTSVFPYSSWAKITKEVVYNNPQLLQRGESAGDIELRRALCDFLHNYRGVVCSPEQIVVGAGMDYLLDVILRLLPKNTLFGIENPGYQATYAVLESAGRRTVSVALDERGMSLDSLRLSNADVAYVTPSHQFPMGLTMPVSRRMELLRWAGEKPHRYIIEDDYDSEFRYAFRPVRAMQGMDEQGKVIYIGTFSRSLAPSIRIAYMVLPENLLGAYSSASRYMSSTVSRFEQHTLCRFIADGLYSRHLRRAGNLYRQKQALLRSLLGEIEGLSVQGDEAGLHFIVKSDRLSERELCSRAEEAGVGITGLSRCYRGEGCPEGIAIIGFAGVSTDELTQAARRLKQVWQTE
ncbi:MAG: PLP-dependent aminotransferase family protein [Clostridia bacterium]|nr:PLP-dependent aminotransferase family protein [Clostridia bacterium]